MSAVFQPIGPVREALIVLGMHRSGTSLLGSLIESLGVEMGQDLYPADEHNPAGYFEDRECVDIQERMLIALGQPWHGPQGMQPMPPQWWRQPAMQSLVGELERWLDRRLAACTGLWGVKDPRTTRFLPLWNELLAQRGVLPRYVLAVRHPAEVAASALTRDGTPPERTHHTWLRYNMDALLHAADRLQGVFVYERWFDDGVAQLQQLAQVVGRSSGGDEAQRLLQTKLREDLHRQKAQDAQAPQWTAAFYAQLKALASCCGARDVAVLASEAEYLDAVLRQHGAVPHSDAPLHAVLSDGGSPPSASLELARRLRDAGHRVVLATDGDLQDVAPAAGIAVIRREVSGPTIGGFERSQQAYRVWLWLAARAYAQVHVEGGMGLAAHVLDARRQGWADWHGPVNVHHLAPPAWLQADGSMQLRGVADAEAVCLERRIWASSAPGSLQGKCALLAGIRQALGVKAVQTPQPMPAPSRQPPLVSIAITHFNRPDLLDDCLQSVRQQSYTPFEVVLVDDGSSQPAALAYLDALQLEFDAKGWTLIRQENRYLGAARNAALRAARGEYVFILDDDNLLMPDGLRRAVQVAERTGADIVTGVISFFSGPAGTQPRWPERVWPQAGNCLLHGALENNVGDANALLRRQSVMVLGGFTEDRGVGAEDWELYLKASLAGLRMEHSLMPFSWYRVDASSMSRAGNWWRDYLRAIRPVEACLPEGLKELPALTNLLLRSVRELEPAAAELPGLRDRLHSAQDMLVQTQQALVQTRLELAQKQQECAAVYRSRSWRATAPFRRAGAVLRLLGLGRLFRSAKRIFR
jgi:hypothetical protein